METSLDKKKLKSSHTTRRCFGDTRTNRERESHLAPRSHLQALLRQEAFQESFVYFLARWQLAFWREDISKIDSMLKRRRGCVQSWSCRGVRGAGKRGASRNGLCFNPSFNLTRHWLSDDTGRITPSCTGEGLMISQTWCWEGQLCVLDRKYA